MKKDFNYELFNYKFRYQKERANATLTSIKDIENFFDNNKSLIIDSSRANLLFNELEDCAYNNKPSKITSILIKLISLIKVSEINLIQSSCALLPDVNRLVFQSYYLAAPAGLLKNIKLPDECLEILKDIYMNYFGMPMDGGSELASYYFQHHNIGNNLTDKFP